MGVDCDLCTPYINCGVYFVFYNNKKTNSWAGAYLMNKKAMTGEDRVTKLIYVLIAGLVLWVFISMVIGSQKDTLSQEMCKNSISIAVNKKHQKFRCPVFMKKTGKTDNGEIMSKDSVKRDIADYMWDCWGEVGAGKLLPYKIDDKKYCLVCNIVEFEDIPPFKGLQLWMATNKPVNKNTRYFNALNGRDPTDDEEDIMQELLDEYDTSKEYAVVWQVSPTIISMSSTVMYGEPKQTIIFEPYSELIPDHCTIVMN